jgi:hypothetical protein
MTSKTYQKLLFAGFSLVSIVPEPTFLLILEQEQSLFSAPGRSDDLFDGLADQPLALAARHPGHGVGQRRHLGRLCTAI